MDYQEMEVETPMLDNETEESTVETTLNATHILMKILQYSVEHHRQKLVVVGTRPRQGDLKGFLDLRLVNKQFNEAVCSTVRKEFKQIQVDIDDHFIRCNEFTIEVHKRPEIGQRRHRRENEGDQGEGSGSESEEDEEMVAVEELPSEDSVDAVFIKTFMQWLANTFEPVVESFKIFDSWTFKPCFLPARWNSRLTVFNSMHPDMEYCNCQQCIETVRSCRRFFGPLSFKMAGDSLKNQKISYEALSCTDSFLADIALEYTNTEGNTSTFEAERFAEDYGGIRCEELNLAVQTLATYRDEHPKPQPLQVIQLLLKLWEVKTVEFEVVKFMENDFYVERCAWERSGAFQPAYFATYSFEGFDSVVHERPYREAGTIDKFRFTSHEILPIFDLRVDQTEGPFRMGSDFSLNSRASGNQNDITFQWLHQGRIAFNMFRVNRILFITAGVMEFRGATGTANWFKFSIRDIMRSTWGPREDPFPDKGKTVYWIKFMEDVTDCAKHVWYEHMTELLEANFPKLKVVLNNSSPFKQCDNRIIATYNNVKRPDVLTKEVNTFYCSFYDPTRNNTTHIKFVQVEN